MSGTRSTKETFLSRIRKTPTCWLYEGVILRHGYGQITICGKRWSTHRYSYSIHKGEIPAGLCVLHKCDNKKCVKPAHLFLGTPLDNTRDMIKKGRSRFPKGEENGHAKLTDDDVRKIRNDDRTYSVISKEYGVCKAVICEVRSRKLWKHVC